MNVFIILLTILILIIIMIIVESHIELNSLRVTEYVLSENVPKSLKGKKMVFISDYHEAVNGKLNQRILDEVKQISPGSAPMAAATCFLAFSAIFLASLPVP